MTEFTRNLRLAGVQVGELKVRRIGPSPIDHAKVAFLTDEGASIAPAIFTAFSPQTRRLIDAALKSIEQDFLEHIQVQDGGPGPSEGDEEPREGLEFG